MKKKERPLAAKDFSKVRISLLAAKYECSVTYVRMLLKGERSSASILARLILRDAHDIAYIYGRDTTKIIKE